MFLLMWQETWGWLAAAAANSAKTVHSSLPPLGSLNQEHTSCCKQPIKCQCGQGEDDGKLKGVLMMLSSQEDSR